MQNKTNAALRNVLEKIKEKRDPSRFSRLLYRGEKLELKIFTLIPQNFVENREWISTRIILYIKSHDFVFTLLFYSPAIRALDPKEDKADKAW